MSRHTVKKGTITIAYGYDTAPFPGYFFQLFDDTMISDDNEEGIIVNEGFVYGITRNEILSLMSEHKVESFPGFKNEHLKQIALDQPI